MHRYPLKFDGPPAEYARIWATNLLMLVLTLGLYFPWARSRQLRFFYQHTSVAGHRFDFHGRPLRMLRPTALFSVFLLLYVSASYINPLAGFVAAVFFTLLWPPVWRASTLFRLGNTSLLGLRFRCSATTAQAYEHVGVPMILFIFPLAWLGVDKSIFDLHSTWTVASVISLCLWLVLYPAVLWQVRRLLHGSILYAGLQTRLRLHARPMFMRFGAVYAVGAMLLVGLGAVAFWLKLPLLEIAGKGAVMDLTYYRFTLKFWLFLGVGSLVAGVILRSIGMAAAHNTLWSRTMADGVRVRANLNAAALLKLQTRNNALLWLTLGLYWPWARVSVLKLKLESTHIELASDFDSFVARRATDAAAQGLDLAADMAGADMGW